MASYLYYDAEWCLMKQNLIKSAAALAADPALKATLVSQAERQARDRRQIIPKWDLAADGLPAISSGLTVSGGYLAASVGGTDGTAIWPLWGVRKNFRASARVKVTKGTASSKSYVGFTVTAPGTAPSGSNFTFGVGYLAGTGIAVIRENVGAPIVIVADSALTDGDLYDVSIQVDRTLSTAAGSATGALKVYAKAVATGTEFTSSTTFTLASFPTNNAMARTNVAAGGLTSLVVSGHPAGPIGLRTQGEINYATGGETTYLHVPASPNGKLVIACHGHGSNPIETGWTSSLYKGTWDALVASGFTVVVPNMGGNLWGNAAAQGYLSALHALMVSTFDLDPACYLWGTSMGAGAALTAIAKDTLPVRAAYLAQSITDLSQLWANPSFSTLPAAYGNDTALRDQYNPISQPASAFAGVPLLFVASASDTTAVKTVQTDAMVAHLGAATTVYTVAATGNHNDGSHYRPQDTVNFFRANL